jgi:hypothetical protein
MTIILFSNYVSLIAITYLIFIPWKKGPEWYLKFSPYVFYTMTYLNFLILPIMNIGITIYYSANPNYILRKIPVESWVVFFTIICVTRLIEYFSSLKKILLDDARIFLETKKFKEEGRLDSEIVKGVG